MSENILNGNKTIKTEQLTSQKIGEISHGAVKPEESTRLYEIPERQAWKIEKADSIAAFIFFAIAFIYVKFPHIILNEGIGSLLFTAAYICAVLFYVWAKKITPPKESYFWLAILVLTGVSKLLFRNMNLSLITELFWHCTAIYWTMSATNALMRAKTGAFLWLDAVRGAFWLPFLRFGAIFIGIVNPFKTLFNKEKSKKLVGVLLGVIICVPVLAIILPLLSEADEAFYELMQSLKLNFNFFGNLILATPVAAYLFSLLYASANTKAPLENAEKMAASFKKVPAVTIALVFGAMLFSFIAFLIVIIMGLIPAFSGLLPGNTSYSAYAREGFFELCRVCCIALGIMAVALSCSKENWRENAGLKAVTVSLSVACIGLCATAFARMMLYIGEFGLTTKRVVTTLFIVFLAIIFVMVCVCTFAKFNITRAAFLLFCAGFTALLLSNSTNFIVSYNLTRYENKTLNSFDLTTLSESYSTDALPALLASYQRLPKTDAISGNLSRRANNLKLEISRNSPIETTVTEMQFRIRKWYPAAKN